MRRVWMQLVVFASRCAATWQCGGIVAQYWRRRLLQLLQLIVILVRLSVIGARRIDVIQSQGRTVIVLVDGPGR